MKTRATLYALLVVLVALFMIQTVERADATTTVTKSASIARLRGEGYGISVGWADLVDSTSQAVTSGLLIVDNCVASIATSTVATNTINLVFTSVPSQTSTATRGTFDIVGYHATDTTAGFETASGTAKAFFQCFGYINN